MLPKLLIILTSKKFALRISADVFEYLPLLTYDQTTLCPLMWRSLTKGLPCSLPLFRSHALFWMQTGKKIYSLILIPSLKEKWSSTYCYSCSTEFLTRDSNGSWSVHWLMFLLTGMPCRVSIIRIFSGGVGNSAGVSGSGRQLKRSALACLSPGLQEMV